ncbi:pyridoxamine 5'-phosphate oxidase family protein [Janibacter cremeus]|uniref:General stress protein 26 n=1 Tax=Janibacter cremeus TaxID=1285192 RepID=A0A852VNT7_9MICO|nr:pyridoxamine 5'-phosphate oxidase family protein [Janibacter cremeus]NYF97796.1 general stress protein 26 [Janibacter cremeus]
MNEEQQTVADIITSTKIAMMTHHSADGALIAHPMATQDVDFTGTVLFIAERGSDKVRDLVADPRVNLAYSGKGSWVSLAGKARIVDDEARLRELWGTFTGAWLEGGPDSPNNILIEVEAESAEYWDAPGSSRTVQLANLARSAIKGERIEGDHDVVDY